MKDYDPYLTEAHLAEVNQPTKQEETKYRPATPEQLNRLLRKYHPEDYE